ncbi:uncharacterized protein N7496_003658 [Penicillium cataractarum]|uniref:Fido domain-containing protein n=1 Tax=Penicillium cataractarum TaxID=2100454 RepID=A0A9W9SML5_9EURO|nr:uncharacterized protein N7496_003658 [Penicillium cataractarum]KAJ5381230.1 hypothetical protein N7496_003658 [Penicillium cataractarum]
MTDASHHASLGQKILAHIKSTSRLEPGTISVSIHGHNTDLTITQDEAYSYEIAHAVFNPELAFSQVIDSMDRLTTLLHNLSDVVYGSNMIDKAGAGLKAARQLSMKVFCGEDTFEEDAQKDDKYYVRIQKQRVHARLPANHTDILQTHREVVQHAKAAAYLIEKLGINGEDLTEDLILETHRILTSKVDAESASWKEYSSVYRTDDVSVGLHTFISPEGIPEKMKEMIRQYNSDLDKAARTGLIDPIMLAAKYAHIFVNIHPFLDGNGRMSRLILNSILLKFGLFNVCLGKMEHDRYIYKEIVASASQLEDTYDGREEEEKPVAYKELASLVLHCSQNHLSKFMKAALK